MVPHLFYYQLIVLGLLWLFVMLSHALAKPQRASRTEARHAQHDPTQTLQGASTVWRLDAQASLCPV